MRILKLVVSWFSLLYLTLYIPFAFMVYFSPWYKLNCRLHPISQRIPTEKAYPEARRDKSLNHNFAADHYSIFPVFLEIHTASAFI